MLRAWGCAQQLACCGGKSCPSAIWVSRAQGLLWSPGAVAGVLRSCPLASAGTHDHLTSLGFSALVWKWGQWSSPFCAVGCHETSGSLCFEQSRETGKPRALSLPSPSLSPGTGPVWTDLAKALKLEWASLGHNPPQGCLVPTSHWPTAHPPLGLPTLVRGWLHSSLASGWSQAVFELPAV